MFGRAILWVAFALLGTAGCGNAFDAGGADEILVDGNRDPLVTSPVGKTFGEPNNSFLEAIVAVFDENEMAQLQGTISRPGDLDVFLLGALRPGDRVILDAETSRSSLDVSIAVFDDQRRLVASNDDREGTSNRFLDSFIEWTARHAGTSYSLVVTDSAFAAMGQATGSYRVDVTITAGGEVPQPIEQTLLLNFEGGFVESPILGTMMMDPFDAANIASVYRGQTEALKQSIVQNVRQNFQRFDVTIITSDDPPPAGDTRFSTLYFGGFNPTAFGMAEAVDFYNADYCDDALLFTDAFTPSVFSKTPTTTQLGIAIGNVASHEAGHLLGLNHVSDDRALMDDRSVADIFLTNQEFMEGPLSDDIMTIGTQDAVLLLDETVGPAPAEDGE